MRAMRPSSRFHAGSLFYKAYSTLQATTFYQLAHALGTCDPLHLEPIIPRIQHAACYIRWLDTVIQEGIGQKLCIECGVIWWTIEDEVSNASDFVSVRGGLGQKYCESLVSSPTDLR